MNLDKKPRVTIYVVTFRRPHLLARALRSLVDQTDPNWVARVVNDDPADNRVQEVIQSFKDARITLYEPVLKRGGAANFNLAFREASTDFASLLEDDNWWQPEFIARMTQALTDHPYCEIACANEVIWRERDGGQWENTGATIWPLKVGNSEWTTSLVDACGSAKLCNSSLMFKTANSRNWQTPDDIPVDVTEHFRERCVPHPFLLVHEPLVNYAETLATNRSVAGSLWGEYQCLLIGSCFHSLPCESRTVLARRIWQQVGRELSPKATSLLMAAWAVPAARSLWFTSSALQRLRFLVMIIRRFPGFLAALSLRRRRKSHWEYLTHSPFKGVLPTMATIPKSESRD